MAVFVDFLPYSSGSKYRLVVYYQHDKGEYKEFQCDLGDDIIGDVYKVKIVQSEDAITVYSSSQQGFVKKEYHFKDKNRRSLAVEGTEMEYEGKEMIFSNPIYVGNHFKGAGSYNFKGVIRDFRIWDVALDEAQIDQLYFDQTNSNDCTPVLPQFSVSPLYSWPLTDGPGHMVDEFISYSRKGQLGHAQDGDDAEPSWHNCNRSLPMGMLTGERKLPQGYPIRLFDIWGPKYMAMLSRPESWDIVYRLLIAESASTLANGSEAKKIRREAILDTKRKLDLLLKNLESKR